MMVIRAADALEISPLLLLSGHRSMKKVFPLERVAEACHRMLSGATRFRVILTMET